MHNGNSFAVGPYEDHFTIYNGNEHFALCQEGPTEAGVIEVLYQLLYG